MSKRQIRGCKLVKEAIRLRLLNALIADDHEKTARQLTKRVMVKHAKKKEIDFVISCSV